MTTQRCAGVLLHPGSLPGRFGSGDFGASSLHFIDWLATAGQHLWQVLPFAPPGCGRSPYMSVSTLAGDPMMVSPERLVDQGLLASDFLDRWDPALDEPADRINHDAALRFRLDALHRAAQSLFDGSCPHADDLLGSYRTWCQTNAWWASDYALFMAIRTGLNEAAWQRWPTELRSRQPASMQAAKTQYREQIDFWLFVQWQFDRQWQAVRDYAAEKNVRIVGDMPIYCADDSVDVWQHPQLFQLDSDGRPTAVAGVPPDYFSETGQLWGNPLYDWPAHEAQQFAWWCARVRRAMAHADIVRIDHFRAFAKYWSVPAGDETAMNGQWLPGPGIKLFDALADTLGALPIIAEDLGTITPDVIELRDRVGLPGMAVLQFAFGGGPDNAYLPHNLTRNCVVYTGTHDNDTSQGWFNSAPEHERDAVRTYLTTDGGDIHWQMIQAASSSVAAMAVYPMQDVLGLGSASRTNTPGLASGQWAWRLSWDQVQPWHAQRLATMSAAHGRHPPQPLPDKLAQSAALLDQCN